jgi:hypothetical protein
MTEAYLDESGIHDDAPFCVIAGYYGNHSRWRTFRKSWHRTLRRFDVPLGEFHAKDAVNKAGFFVNWDRRTHTAFFESLVSDINQSRIKPVAAGIVVNDFYSFSDDQRRFFTGAQFDHGRVRGTGCPNKPYYVPFQHVLRHVCDNTPGAKVRFAFGVNRPFSKYAASLFKLIKLHTKDDRHRRCLAESVFPFASETPQLQAADLLAYLTYDHMRAAMKTRSWHKIASPILNALNRNARGAEDAFYLDAWCLHEHLKQIPIQDRGDLLTK